MITFWLMATGLLVVIIAASLFVLPVLLGKKPPVAADSQAARIMGRQPAAIATGIAIPVLTVMLYLAWPGDLLTPALETPSGRPEAAQGQKMEPQHAQMVEDMAARMEQNPGDGKGWAMLGNSYAVMGRYAEAVIAYEKAAKLLPDDAQLLVDYADVMAVANDRNLRGKPLELISKALKLDPKNVKGLALIGTAAFQTEDYASAVKYWEKALKLLPPDSPFARQMSSGIADARALAAGKEPPSQIAARNMTQPAATGAHISGVLTLSPALAAKASPTDSVFLSAKQVSGPPMPVAVLRAQVKDLPLQFTLDDSMAMMPEMKLSNFKEVMLSAKVTKSGNTATQRGDLTGELTPVKVGANGVSVVIDKIAP